jgi:hypothetical protein
MGKHTPGPWEVVEMSDGKRFVAVRPGYLCDRVATVDGRCGIPGPGPSDERLDANARLIAAAPKLYALVRAWSISVPHGAHSDTCRAMIAEIEGE